MSNQSTGLDTEGASVKENFFSHFKNQQTLLEEQIGRLKDTNLHESERGSMVDVCLSGISNLSNEVKHASSYLPAYDQRTVSTAIKNLTEKLQAARSASAPRRRFAFKRPAALTETTGASPAGPIPQHSRSLPSSRGPLPELPNDSLMAPSGSIAGNDSNSDSNHQTLTITSLLSTSHRIREDALRSAASVTVVKHSFVDLTISATSARPFSTLAIKGVLESLLVCGQVSGSTHVTGVESSTLLIWSRQVRLHECNNCVLYLRCNSRPIIEDCRGIRFAPLPASLYLPLGETPVSSTPNLWNQVDDFKWLRAEQSPNWSVLQPDDEHAIDDEGWETITAGEVSQLELDGLLKVAT